jgi:hypothetical protein
MPGGHHTKSPDEAWTIALRDGPISSGFEGVRMDLYRGDRPISMNDKPPTLTFEVPLPSFDARSSRTTDKWTKDGSECHLTLATDVGEAFLIVTPAQSLVRFDTHPPTEIIHSSNPLLWILPIIAMLFWIGLKRIKRVQPSS